MKINSLSDFKKICAMAKLEDFFNEPQTYISINTTPRLFTEALMNDLKPISNNSELLVIAILVQHEEDSRIDNLFLICRKSELVAAFIEQLSFYIQSKNADIIGFLKKEWQSDQAKYPLVFTWTTRVNDEYTLIGNRAVAPQYQGKGLMKSLSLALVDHLFEHYGPKHQLKAITVHPATYLFFNPPDKTLKHYMVGDLQEQSCGTLLSQYKKNEIKPLTITPEVVAFLTQHGFLKAKDKESETKESNLDLKDNNAL